MLWCSHSIALTCHIPLCFPSQRFWEQILPGYSCWAPVLPPPVCKSPRNPNLRLLGLLKVHTDPWAAAKTTPGAFHPCKNHMWSTPREWGSAHLAFCRHLLIKISIKISIKARSDVLCLEFLLLPSGDEGKLCPGKKEISAGEWSFVFRNLKGWNLVKTQFLDNNIEIPAVLSTHKKSKVCFSSHSC